MFTQDELDNDAAAFKANVGQKATLAQGSSAYPKSKNTSPVNVKRRDSKTVTVPVNPKSKKLPLNSLDRMNDLAN